MLSDAEIASMSNEQRIALSRRLAAFNADLMTFLGALRLLRLMTNTARTLPETSTTSSCGECRSSV